MSDEDDYNPKSHKTLLQNISNLGKTQHIRKAIRSEPQPIIDEFHLLKTKKSDIHFAKDNKVAVNDIVQILKTSEKHADARKQLRNVAGAKKVLETPLEKPKADRIKRTIGYENVKKKLGRWDAVVAKNRSAETHVFPLPGETVYVNTAAYGKPLQTSLKSQLALEMEEAEAKLKTLKRESKGDFTNEKEQARIERELLEKKMTKDEIIAHRRELAFLRMKESQKSAKARLQNKIKSKKYHKLLKRQKIKAQIKEFEMLQKTDPEAALEKLSAIEKSRALERASLRHKNTGSWAKNLQVRAKYDKEVRKDLAEQLQMSREITQKKLELNSDEDEDSKTKDSETEEMKSEVDPFNPWVKVTKNGKKVVEKETDVNWRKYWTDRNENDKLLNDYRKEFEEAATNKEDSDDEMDDIIQENNKQKSNKMNEDEDDDAVPTTKKGKGTATIKTKNSKKLIEETSEQKSKDPVKVLKTKTSKAQTVKKSKDSPVGAPAKRKNSASEIDEEDKSESKKPKKKANIAAKTKGDKTKKKKTVENGGWEESLLEDDEIKAVKLQNGKHKNIDDLFDEIEDLERENLEKQLQTVIKTGKKMELMEKKAALNRKLQKLKGKKIKNELKNLEDLSFKKTSQRPDIDEELSAETNEKTSDNKTGIDHKSAANGNSTGTASDNTKASSSAEFIDPNQFASIKLQTKLTKLNEINDGLADEEADMDENEDFGTNQQMTISQAFEDDDIVADFSAEKQKESEIKNAEIDLFMPGWGSWAGAGVEKKPNPMQNKTIKLKVDEDRKDSKKDKVIINEDPGKHLRNHLVSDLPFPFTSLKDYEASIRAPIGRTFVPETAFKMLTRPSVITKKGQLIEPMDESEIVKPARKLRHEVDKRIKRLQSPKTAPKPTPKAPIKKKLDKQKK